jgi:hypothetical protein
METRARLQMRPSFEIEIEDVCPRVEVGGQLGGRRDGLATGTSRRCRATGPPIPKARTFCPLLPGQAT